jgi:hypothetical protein
MAAPLRVDSSSLLLITVFLKSESFDSQLAPTSSAQM